QGAIELLAGLEITAAGEPLDWKRNEVEVYAFHVDVPAGAEELELRFQCLSPTSSTQGRIVATPDMLNLQWSAMLLYPAGHHSQRIQFEPAVSLPEGWQLACALAPAATEGTTTRFAPVALDVLVDSPIFAGRHVRRIPLDAQGQVQLNLVADRAHLLAATPAQIDAHRALITQADKLFGGRPFARYDFLVALSEELGGIGVEHHSSCEIATEPDYFTKWDERASSRDVMGHEYTHAWNGKYRRGADSWTPTFDQPIHNSLMWVYEGQTQYWGNVLSARAGLWTLQQALDALARTAAVYSHRPGRRWRTMSDTTRDPIIASRKPLPWVSWQLSEDYYSEGQLMWLDIDTRLRELSADTRSLDDFAARFFATNAKQQASSTSTYTFEDVVEVLQGIVAFDWQSYLRGKLETRSSAPLEGLARGGYRLVYRPTPSEFARQADATLGVLNLRFSLGITVATSGALQEVLWESPAFEAGLTAGAEVLAVNGRAYSPDGLEQAIIDAQDGAPIALSLKRKKRHYDASIRYRGGLRFPHLEPIEGARPRLDEIYKAR
ncbi:MAG: peptidase, partial [Myxococcaceae bacterium]|nr:peptidase [Myxococcaceae bacterium]